MMRAQRLLERSTRAHICLLCSSWPTRQASARPSSRRYLQYSHRSSKPPSAAEAISEEDEGDFQEYAQQVTGPSGGDRPRWGSGWAPQTNSVDLTPEERQQREALRLRHHSSQSEAIGPRGNYRVRIRYDGPRPNRSIGRGFDDLLPIFGPPGEQARKGIPQNPNGAFRLDGSMTGQKRSEVSLSRGPVRFTVPKDVGSPPIDHRRGPTITSIDRLRIRGDNTEKPRITEGKSNDTKTEFEVTAGDALKSRRVNLDDPSFFPGAKNYSKADFDERLAKSKNGGFVGFTHRSRQLQRWAGTTDQPQGVKNWKPNLSSKEQPTDAQYERRQFLPRRVADIATAKETVAWSPLAPTIDPNLDVKPKEESFSTDFVENSSLQEAQVERQRRRAQKFDLDPVTQEKDHGDRDSLRSRRRGRTGQRGSRAIIYEEEFDEDDSRAAKRREHKKEKLARKKAERKAGGPPIPILLPEFISVENLARVLRVRTEDFTRKLHELGFEETTYDHVLNSETAGLIAMEYNFAPMTDQGESEDLFARAPAEDTLHLPTRPPVVTIMGHVDHGKTTILDWLRKSAVAASEHGGITQHIGAFSVSMPSGKLITFLDTPGHAAFLSMRQRGANVTDVVVLVVAADDSVKPQTIEAIKHAKEAKVPIIVAINKIDKEEANVDRVKQDLARHGVEVEDYGGDTQVVCVSGKTGHGMEDLEEAIVTLSEILDMRAETDGPAEGWVLEASTKKEGRVATILVRRGTLRVGDVIVAGPTWARVRRLRNEAGIDVSEAGPGTPVEVDGWKEQPSAGDEMLQAPDEGKARSVVEYRIEQAEQLRLAADMDAINEYRRLEQDKRTDTTKAAGGEEEGSFNEPASASRLKEVFFVVKGDVSGSVEAVLNSVLSLGNEEVRPHVLRSGVGPVSEFDVEHAAAANGHIINFNTMVEQHISRLAETSGVKILDHQIIYKLVDDVKEKLSEKLSPIVTQRVSGEADIAQIFDINVKGRVSKPVAGCKIRNGIVTRNAKARVLRGKEIVYDGSISSLKHVKKDVTEMRKGGECGVGFEDWQDFHVGDQVQCYEERVEKRSL